MFCFSLTKKQHLIQKNIEILYSEKKTPPIVYFIWAMVQIVVMSSLGVGTFVLVLTVSGIID